MKNYISLKLYRW